MEWAVRGACRGSAEQMFAEGAAQNGAKSVCYRCPVRMECLSYALDRRMEHGVWGGMTERERRALLRRNPTVVSWRQALERAYAGQQPAAREETVRETAAREATVREAAARKPTVRDIASRPDRSGPEAAA
ncbi:WhiB family transcriptional regulator [Streptomyces sp. NRRL S-340]|uniref:WhiB family transcriptional regulator n=1 Tax=Streptomyces sp. NRRL S-340 TaxID=1463901 RepID=UPI000689D7E9|nr:WhiB family transcriptional regulator [Streptomyces sp. NRRL S-340]